MNSEKWDEFFKEKQKALIFDTVSSGFGYKMSDILSLSWQVIDLHSWSKLSEGDVLIVPCARFYLRSFLRM